MLSILVAEKGAPVRRLDLAKDEVTLGRLPDNDVVLASGGYPREYRTDLPIQGLEAAAADSDVVVFHAGTARAGGELVTAGGRVLGVTARGAELRAARDLAPRRHPQGQSVIPRKTSKDGVAGGKEFSFELSLVRRKSSNAQLTSFPAPPHENPADEPRPVPP